MTYAIRADVAAPVEMYDAMHAEVVRRSESTVLRVRADGADLIVEVDSVDEDGNRVEPGPLPTPPSPAIETTPTGVRVRNAVAS